MFKLWKICKWSFPTILDIHLVNIVSVNNQTSWKWVQWFWIHWIELILRLRTRLYCYNSSFQFICVFAISLKRSANQKRVFFFSIEMTHEVRITKKAQTLSTNHPHSWSLLYQTKKNGFVNKFCLNPFPQWGHLYIGRTCWWISIENNVYIEQIPFELVELLLTLLKLFLLFAHLSNTLAA